MNSATMPAWEPAPNTPPYDSATDPFANNAFFVQFQVRFM